MGRSGFVCVGGVTRFKVDGARCGPIHDESDSMKRANAVSVANVYTANPYCFCVCSLDMCVCRVRVPQPRPLASFELQFSESSLVMVTVEVLTWKQP